MLTTTEIEFFKENLEKRKVQLEENLLVTSKEMSSLRNNELKDEGDHATMSLENTVENAILGQQSEELAEIEEALDRIKDNTYGVCEMCSSEINIERLKVKVFARYCIVCREVVEKSQES